MSDSANALKEAELNSKEIEYRTRLALYEIETDNLVVDVSVANDASSGHG